MSPEQSLIQEQLILTQVGGDNAQQVLERMADALLQSGHVKPGFAEAVIEREANHPTGLPTASVGVAIPHADPDYVLKPAICVGFPEHHVPFRVMGEEEETVQVGVIFMLALNRSEQQLALFQSLMDFIQDESLLPKLLHSPTAHSAADLLTDRLRPRG